MLAVYNLQTNRSFPAAVSLSFIGRHLTTTFTLSALDGNGFGGCNEYIRRNNEYKYDRDNEYKMQCLLNLLHMHS